MQDKYQQYINKHGETFDVGEHLYVTRFLRRVKSSRTRLPINMHNGGLLIFGCQKSYRRRLANHYARTLIEAGKKVLFITDALTQNQYRAKLEIDSFNKHMGIDQFKDGEVHFEPLTGNYNPDIFDNGAKLYVVNTDQTHNGKSKEEQKHYDERLLSLLSAVRDIEYKNYCNRNLKDRNEVVVFIDEDWQYGNLDQDIIRSLKLDFHRYDVGLVVCSGESYRYHSIILEFKHYVFFRIRDPQEILQCFRHFNRYHIDMTSWKQPYKYKPHLDLRDVTNLEPKSFYYFQSSLIGFSNLSTFDADGCDCCKPEPECYYGYKEE